MKLANALCRFRELAMMIDIGAASDVAAEQAQWLNSPERDPLANT
jgi:hypothetical protein